MPVCIRWAVGSLARCKATFTGTDRLAGWALLGLACTTNTMRRRGLSWWWWTGVGRVQHGALSNSPSSAHRRRSSGFGDGSQGRRCFHHQILLLFLLNQWPPGQRWLENVWSWWDLASLTKARVRPAWRGGMLTLAWTTRWEALATFFSLLVFHPFHVYSFFVH